MIYSPAMTTFILRGNIININFNLRPTKANFVFYLWQCRDRRVKFREVSAQWHSYRSWKIPHKKYNQILYIEFDRIYEKNCQSFSPQWVPRGPMGNNGQKCLVQWNMNPRTSIPSWESIQKSFIRIFGKVFKTLLRRQRW